MTQLTKMKYVIADMENSRLEDKTENLRVEAGRGKKKMKK